MRYDREHKAEIRKRVIDAAGRRFRKNGIDGTGVADLMADVGLTHGGFYGHFPSKESLVQEMITAAANRSNAHMNRMISQARATGKNPLEAVLRDYLSPAHRDRTERGCTVASLGAEIARRPKQTREALTDSIAAKIALLTNLLPVNWPDRKRQQVATTIFSIMVGALQMARATSDSTASERILEAGIAGAMALAEAGR